jgi:DNA-directed RNA polymerase subunit RPC12/RpoP
MGEKMKTVLVDEQDFLELKASGVKNFSAFVRDSMRNAIASKRRLLEREAGIVHRCDKCGTEAPKSAWKSWSNVCPKCSARHFFQMGLTEVEKNEKEGAV